MPTSRRRYERALVAAGVAVLALAPIAHAASVLDFDRWMSRIEKRALSLQKSLDRGDVAASLEDAREIESLYRSTEDYFTEMGDVPRAVELSNKGWRAATDLVTRLSAPAHAGTRADAQSIIKTLMEDCRTCHNEFKPLT